jgi:CelD/BcsL family acetyltransferase involved in cellulose biosynthesis
MVERGGTLRSPTNYHSPMFGFLALDRPVVDDFAATALRYAKRAVTLSFLDAHGTTQIALENAARERRHLYFTRTLKTPPYVPTDGHWTEYERRRSAKLLSDLRRCERRLAEEGRPTVEIHTDGFDLDRLLEDCFRTEAASWKGVKGTAISSQSATRSFYTDVGRLAYGRGELMLAFLRLDDRPIAMQLNIVCGGTVTVLKLGHDEQFNRFAPGKLLIRHVLRHCFESDVTCYDFSGQPSPYKMQWAEGQRQLTETRTFTRALPGLAAYTSWRYGRPLAKRVLALAR